MSIRKMSTGERRRKKGSIYEPNLAKAQALVVAWHFLLPSYSSCLSRHHTHHDLLAASYLLSSSLLAPSLTSYSSLCIVQLSGVSVTLRAALTLSQSSPSYSPHLTCNHTRHVLLAIVLAAGTLIDIILAASYLLSFSPLAPSLTSYLSRCIVQLPTVCHSESCANHVTKLAIILAVSYLQSFSPCPTCYRPCRRRCAHHHPPHSCHAHRVVLIASCSSRRAHRVVLIASCSSRRAHRVVLITSCSSRCVVFPNFPLFPTLRAMLCMSKTAAMDVTLGACAGNAKCGSSISRCTLDIKNRTGLSHYAWNPLHVCECDVSICCNVPCLDSQCNHSAMTRIVRMPFALTRLRQEGKCPDTAVSRRKMP